MKYKIPKISLYSLFVIMLFTQSRCMDKDKTPPKTVMPEITQEGKNTIGCYVNGELYAVPSIVQLNEIGFEYYFDNYDKKLKSLNVYSGNGIKSDIEQHLSLYVRKEIIDTGYYPLQLEFYNVNYRIEKARFSLDKGIRQYYTCPQNGYGWLHISRFDTLQNIVSGTFEFDATNDNNPSDKIEVRDGRFDIKL